MKQYFNKLVRDKIPDIVSKDNRKCVFEILNNDDYTTQLDLKLIEECNEVVGAKSDDQKVKELADVLEVVYSIAENIGIEVDYLETVRLSKKLKNGGFKSRLFLKEIVSDN